MDSKTEQQLLKWLDGVLDEEFAPIDYDSDVESAPSDHSENASDTQQSGHNELNDWLTIKESESFASLQWKRWHPVAES